MFKDLGGGLWVMIDVIAVVVLGIAIAYGTMTWKRRRNRTLEGIRDDATKKLYQDEEKTKRPF